MPDQRSLRESERLPKRLCDWCRTQVDPWGVKVVYEDRWFHLLCWDDSRKSGNHDVRP